MEEYTFWRTVYLMLRRLRSCDDLLTRISKKPIWAASIQANHRTKGLSFSRWYHSWASFSAKWSWKDSEWINPQLFPKCRIGLELQEFYYFRYGQCPPFEAFWWSYILSREFIRCFKLWVCVGTQKILENCLLYPGTNPVSYWLIC